MQTDFWEPPQAATRYDLITAFHRPADPGVLHKGKKLEGELIGQSRACILIESFVDRVLKNEALPYQCLPSSPWQPVVHATPLGKRLREVIGLLGFFDSYHEYSEKLCAFLHSCWLITSIYGVSLPLLSQKDIPLDGATAEHLNDIVRKLRMCAGEGWFRRAASDRRWESGERTRATGMLVEKILKHYARTTVVRVDLSYHKREQARLSIDTVYQHLDQLLYLKDWHPVFEHLTGYVWALEQGKHQGYHLHTAFCFDGSRVCRDATKGFAIADVWVQEITGGMGKANICNAHKEQYDPNRLGIGVIDRLDGVSCLNTIASLQYLAKESQYLRMKPTGRRSYGTGLAPSRETLQGRPPQRLPDWHYECGQGLE
ncbi:MAG: inovirus-type Gp2 protein [Pseudomonadales bacterium]|nr:inovirus-type Gp2 protein [Pseudomonadales bacterium]